jgi:hypothetical protein
MKVKRWIVVLSVREVEVDDDDQLESATPKPTEDETYVTWPFDSKEEAKERAERILDHQ